jgi:hypothetical protein
VEGAVDATEILEKRLDSMDRRLAMLVEQVRNVSTFLDVVLTDQRRLARREGELELRLLKHLAECDDRIWAIRKAELANCF